MAVLRASGNDAHRHQNIQQSNVGQNKPLTSEPVTSS